MNDKMQHKALLQLLRNGNILCTSRDSVFEIKSNGEIVWRNCLDDDSDDVDEQRYWKTEVFTDSSDNYYIVDDDSTACYDSLGEKKYSVVGKGEYADEQGNLYVRSNTSLRKILPNGTIAYEKNLSLSPMTRIVNIAKRKKTGDVVVTALANISLMNTASKTKKTNDVGVVKYDDDNGNETGKKQSTVGKYESKHSGNNVDDTEEDFAFEFEFEDSSGNQVVLGDYSVKKRKTKEESSTVEDATDWGILGIKSNLKSKLKRVKGAGKEESSVNGGKRTNRYNGINDAEQDSKGFVYIGGSYDERKFKKGIRVSGGYTPVVAKYDIAKQKILWTKRIEQNTYNAVREMTMDTSDNCYLSLNDGHTVYVLDENGNTLRTITFADSLAYFILEGTQTVYAIVDSYVVKYSLPAAKFAEENIAVRYHSFSLEQNYPNPFNPVTTIHYTLSTAGNVSLKVYDVLGREVATLLNNELLEEGMHEVQFDASTLSSGMYFYRLTAQSEEKHFVSVKKLLLLK